MQTVAIVSKPHKEELARILPELVAWLRNHDYDPLLDREGGVFCQDAPIVDRAELPKHEPTLVIVLGGDGTLLAAARAFAKTGIPILSVNLGSLGFLTSISVGDLFENSRFFGEGLIANLDVHTEISSHIKRWIDVDELQTTLRLDFIA